MHDILTGKMLWSDSSILQWKAYCFSMPKTNKLPTSKYVALVATNLHNNLKNGKRRAARTTLAAMRKRGCALWPAPLGLPGGV
jgi:hypothetical protein